MKVQLLEGPNSKHYLSNLGRPNIISFVVEAVLSLCLGCLFMLCNPNTEDTKRFDHVSWREEKLQNIKVTSPVKL